MIEVLPKILLVEDNPDDYEATVRSFEKNHLANPVQWCRSGQDALDYVRREGGHSHIPVGQRPCLIFLDLNMPGLDGRKVLKALKNDDRTKQIPVVILTTSADPKDVEQCYALGASTYIQKPVSFERLVDAVRTMKDYWFKIALLPMHGD
jgi:two-component system response regulator